MKVSTVLCGVNEEIKFKKQLIESAGQMYRRLGIKSVSMDDVAREMGVSKKTIYTIVENKEALVDLVMECDFEKDMTVMSKNLRESKDAIDEFLRNSRYFIRQMREISPATLRDLKKYYPKTWEQQLQGHQEEFKRSIIANLERGMEEGLYRSDLHTEIIATLHAATVGLVIDTSVFPANERTISEVINHHGRYHLNGIVNQFGRDRVEAYLQQEDLD